MTSALEDTFAFQLDYPDRKLSPNARGKWILKEDALNARIAELEEENETLKTACDILRGDNNLLFKRLMSIETPGDLQTLKIVYVKEDSEVQE